MITVSHVLSATTPDNTSYEIRPSHWNSAHAVTQEIFATEISGLFSNANGLSFGLSNSSITGSYTVPTQTQFVLSDSNGLTWGTNGSTVTGSYSQSTHAHSSLSFADSNGISFGINGSTLTATVKTDYLTTAMASNRGSDFVQATAAFAGTSASGTIASNGISVSIGPYLTTAMASNRGSDFVQATAAFAGTNASGTIASNGISVSVAAPGGGATVSMFQPFLLLDATATSTGSVDHLQLAQLMVPQYVTFGQMNAIGSASVAPTSAGNTFSFRLTNNQSIGYSAVYSITNSNLVNLVLYQRGAGNFSTEIESIGSTRNSFVTFYNLTFSASVNHTAGSTGSVRLSQSVSMSISFPGMTSGQVINGASTDTTWGTGYTVWTSSASTQVTNTYNTTNTASTSVASTYPATTAWASNKLIPLQFGSSLSPGEYWIGMYRDTGTSSSSTFGSTITAPGTGASYTATYNASGFTQTGQITWLGDTNSIASSLGWMGQNTGASIAPAPGHGSFTGTYDVSATYLNNAGNPAGAIAFSQINTNVSFFRSWVQFASNRI